MSQPSYLSSKFLLVVACLWMGSVSLAEDFDPSDSSAASSGSQKKAGKIADEDDENIIRRPKEDEAPPPKVFSKAEVQKACEKYRGKLISVYGEIYKLENCVRHLIHDQETVYKFSRQATPIVEVEASEVAALPVGDSWEQMNTKERPCSKFHKQYVTYSYTDIYFVENCVRKLIPDYETLLAHRKQQGQRNGEVLALTAKEFWSMRQGRDISSIIDKEFGTLKDGSAGVDIIPVDEACKGVDGKIVSFYSRLYKIEKCRKREIDAESFTMRRKLGDIKIVELRPEQWVSIPDGKPYDEGRDTKRY